MWCLGCSFPVYKAWLLWYVSFVLVCRLRLDTIGPARLDLLETPRHARPRVCVQSFIRLPLKDCHAFTSLLVSLLLLRCRMQRLVWKAWCWGGGGTGVYSGGLGRDCEHGDFNDLMGTVQRNHTPARLCGQLTLLCFLPFCVSPVKESQNDALDESDYNWRGTNY